uniref:hypothetical protein n=1 Tax=Lentilactobacillus hilgardii TaxID=1588 RepID=UPI00403F2DF4
MNNHTIHSLEDVFNDPKANELLVPKSKPKTVNSNPDVEHFKEIQEWVKQHGGKELEKTRDMSRTNNGHLLYKCLYINTLST